MSIINLFSVTLPHDDLAFLDVYKPRNGLSVQIACEIPVLTSKYTVPQGIPLRKWRRRNLLI